MANAVEVVRNQSPWADFKFRLVESHITRRCESCGQPIDDDELYPVCPMCGEHWDEELDNQCVTYRGGKYACSACQLKFVRVELNGKVGFVTR